MTDIQKLAAMMASLVIAGIILLGVLSVTPATSDRARSLWRLMGTQVLISGVVISIFLGGAPALALALVLIACRVVFESARIWMAIKGVAEDAQSLFSWSASLALALASAATIFLPPPYNFAPAFGVLVLLFGVAVSPGGSTPANRIAMALAGVCTYPGLAILASALAVRNPQCHLALLLAFMLTEVFDSFAVLGGRLFGRHAMFPRLSPRKTVEGWLSGFAVLVAVVLALPLVVKIPSHIVWAVPVAVAVAATAGDLLGSAPKRAAGVKDYPAVLEAQGGLLDILDAWLVVGPALAAVWLWLS